MRRFTFTLPLLLLAVTITLSSQVTELSGIINSYARVTAIDYCTNSLIVDDTSGFVPGGTALLIQMQGAVVDTSNTVAFGNVLDYRSAGRVVLVTVAEVTDDTIHIVEVLPDGYQCEYSVQLVSMPHAENAIVTGTLRPAFWNGLTGGIIALDVAGTLTLIADINADGAGFRGGQASPNYHDTLWYDTISVGCFSGFSGWKGEGIAALSNYAQCGRGALANGGGGGNLYNGGGGGGANGGAGGRGGGEGYDIGSNGHPNGAVGGEGGHPSTAFSAPLNRLFLGGAGGGGQQNNSRGSDGGAGGGMIVLRAGTLVSNGYHILANGIQPDVAGIDGAGGGGAGGTIVIDIDSFNDQCQVEARGGQGGNNNSDLRPWITPPGGGGGGGIILTTHSSILPAIHTNVKGGSAGRVVNDNQPLFNNTLNSTSGTDGAIHTGYSFPFTADPFLALAFPPSPDHVICAGSFGEHIGTSATGGNGQRRYHWTPSSGLSSDTIATPLARPDTSTIYVCRVTDAHGCTAFDTVSVTVIQSDLQVSELQDDRTIGIDTTMQFTQRCRDLHLVNTGAVPLLIDHAFLPGNLVFSVPPSQFPLTIPPGAERTVTVCFAPPGPDDYTDTLMLDLGCTYVIPLHAHSPLLTLSGSTECGPTIILNQIPDSLTVLKVGLPYPNPAGDIITLPVLRHIPRGSEQRMEACQLLNLFGIPVVTADYQLVRSQTHNESIEEEGIFMLDGHDLPPGLYFVSLNGPDGTIIHPVVISR